MASTPRPAPAYCGTCQQDPQKRFGHFGECSHVECPNRRSCWSDGTGPAAWAIQADDDALAALFDQV